MLLKKPAPPKLTRWSGAGIATRRVMATPPVVGALATATAIGSGILWPAVKAFNTAPFVWQLGEHFKYHGAGSPTINGGAFPDYLYVKFTSLTSTFLATAPYVVSFYFMGTALEIQFKGMAGSIMLKVDDEYVSLTPVQVTSTGSTYFLPVTFATRATRRIDVIMSGMPFGGVQTGPNDTIAPAETRGPRCIVVGDSFTDGTGAAGGVATGWARVFGDSLGWDDVWASADGGTGYLNPGAGGRVKFRDRIVHDCTAYVPDVVIVQGGHNDYNYNPGGGIVTAAQIQAEASALFAQIKAALPPYGLLVVTSPFWHGGPSTIPAALIGARDAIKTAAIANGGVFLDVLEMPLPSEYVPIVTTLSVLTAPGASAVSLPVGIPQRGVMQIEGDRAEVKALAGTGPYVHTIDGTLLAGHAAGVPVTQVGAPLWTGTGRVGAASGYGNSDLLVSADAIHPTQEGHEAIAAAVARLLVDSKALAL